MTRRVGWLAAASLTLLAAVAVLLGGHAVNAAPAARQHALVLNDDAPTQWAMRAPKGAHKTRDHQRVHYHRHSVVRVLPKRVADLPALHQLLLDLNIDVWSAHRDHIDVRAADAHELKQALNRYLPGIRTRTLVADLEKEVLAPHWCAIDKRVTATARPSVASRLHDPTLWFAEYHDLDEIYEWYQLLAAEHNDRITLMRHIGTTHEGRELMALRFTNHASTNLTQTKKQFYVQGGIHAREWIAHATTQYIAYNLATSDDKAITSLLDEAEIVLVPVVNPDGYVYSWTSDRLWRKNRRADERGVHGVDLNRNYPSHWGESGASKFRFSEVYMGPSAGSEPEVQALMALFNSLPRVVAALDLHSCGQAILRPFAWTLEDTMHEPQLRAVSETMAQIIKNVHGKTYVSEKGVELYPHSATATDWWYDQSRPLENLVGKHDVDGTKLPARGTVFRPYSYTIELRPSQEDLSESGVPGFILDERHIIPVGEEILAAFLYYVRSALDNVLTE
ncbi:hypothetical protein GGF31_001414 [Allomyces arbusculus]|nr:hypothetical protein GGF31_001414 [Allomyces arbusculus]